MRTYINNTKGTALAPLTTIITNNNHETTEDTNTLMLNNISLSEFNILVEDKAKEITESKIKEIIEAERKKFTSEFHNLVKIKAGEIAKIKINDYIKADTSTQISTSEFNKLINKKANELVKIEKEKQIKKPEQYSRFPHFTELLYLISNDAMTNKVFAEITTKIIMANFSQNKYILLDKEKDFGPIDTKNTLQKKIITQLISQGYLINEFECIERDGTTLVNKQYWKVSWNKKSIIELIK